MSINLHLAHHSRNKRIAHCDLFQTRTEDTYNIMRAKSNYERMVQYFDWFDRQPGFGAGQRIDHKLEVAIFLVKHPKAEFYAV